MKRILSASLVLAFLVVASPALAKQVSPRHRGVYYYLRRHVVRKYGVRPAGRNILRDGRSDERAVTDADIVMSIGVYERILHPPPAPVYTSSTVSSSTPSVGGACGGDTPYPGGGQCWAIPYTIVSCESGGQNVPNNQGSGANGYYQLMVGGTGSRAEQDAAAHALWANGAGGGNWRQCGG